MKKMFRVKKMFLEDFAELRCAECHGGYDHDHQQFDLTSRCHPDVPMWPSYDRTTNTVTMQCAECGAVVLEIGVASKAH